MYIRYLTEQGPQHGNRLAALCDINPGRLAYWNRKQQERYGGPSLPLGGIDDFERLLREHRIGGVIVTTVDRTHDEYICRAMEAGCDVITEKPMTTDEDKCRRILDTQKRTGRDLRVTFNYRYAPRNSKIKELLMDGVIGQVTSLHFEWLLDTKHGADYFRRWHRDKRNSGGLMVHKATHHFDLVNWWIDSLPERVMAMGDLTFYGRANAEARGVRAFYDRGTGSPQAEDDPFALQMKEDESKKDLYNLYHLHEEHDGYLRDRSVFSDGISIEDDMSVLVRYRNRATLTYHLTAYSPWEGYRVMFNGTRGRLEVEVQENSYVSGDRDDPNLLKNVGGTAPHTVTEPQSLLIRPLWGQPQSVEMSDTNEGGHGGGDRRMLEDIFVGGKADPLHRAADHLQGAASILTGVAANRSMASGLPVDIRDLRCLPDAPVS